MIIGGAEIYALGLDYAQRLYRTLIDAELEGDTWFPAIDEAQWQLISTEQHPADARHQYAYEIQVLERRQAPPKKLPVADTPMSPGWYLQRPDPSMRGRATTGIMHTKRL
jgi:hypothetical protein